MKITYFKDKPWKLFIAHAACIIAFFALIYILLFSKVIFGNGLLAPYDGLVYSLPDFYSSQNLWTNLLYGGFPKGADPQAQIWYPTLRIFSLIPNSWNAFIISGYVLASSFTYGYVLKLTNSKTSALISGLAYGMSMSLVERQLFVPMIHTISWLPLLLWGLEEIKSQQFTPRIAIASFVTSLGTACMFLAGHPQSFIYSVGLSIAYAIVYILQCIVGKNKGMALIYLIKCCAIFFAAISIIAFALIPEIELAKNSVRATLPFSEFISGSLQPVEFLNVIYPFLFGASQKGLYASYTGYAIGPHEVASYTGILTLLLASIAFLHRKISSHSKFWLAWVCLAFILAIGGHTPLAKFMYHVPGYNIVRVPSRHTFEISFGLAVLAGIGVKEFFISSPDKQVRLLKRLVIAGFAIFGLLNISLFFLLPSLILEKRVAGSITNIFLNWLNPAIFIPSLLFIAAIGCLCWVVYISKNNLHKKAVLVAFLCLDLSAAAWFGIWRYRSHPTTVLEPPAIAVKYEKSLDQTNQRLVTGQGAYTAELKMVPNLTQLWDLPNLSGYGPLILERYSKLLEIKPTGEIADKNVFLSNKTLDILACRYFFANAGVKNTSGLLDGLRNVNGQNSPVLVKDGLQWTANNLGIVLNEVTNEVLFEIDVPQARSVSLVSSMSSSVNMADNSPVLQVTLEASKSETQELILKAGKDTSEWAYDRPDILGKLSHKRAQIFSSRSVVDQYGSYKAHTYLSSSNLPKPQSVKRLRIKYLGSPEASINLDKITLVGDRPSSSYPVDVINIKKIGFKEADSLRSSLANKKRWRYVEDANGMSIYENLRAMPRVWLVPEVMNATADEILNAIKSSQLPDGRSFDPTQVALVEEKVHLKPQAFAGATKAEILKLDDTEIEVRAATPAPAFLVLSDIYYPGWQVSIDGKRTHLVRTNYILRGLLIPPGEHTIKFEYKPLTFRAGVGISSASLFVWSFFLIRYGTLGRKSSKLENL